LRAAWKRHTQYYRRFLREHIVHIFTHGFASPGELKAMIAGLKGSRVIVHKVISADPDDFFSSRKFTVHANGDLLVAESEISLDLSALPSKP
jgi:hypothetical protein